MAINEGASNCTGSIVANDSREKQCVRNVVSLVCTKYVMNVNFNISNGRALNFNAVGTES
jgi:hypothetical protein